MEPVVVNVYDVQAGIYVKMDTLCGHSCVDTVSGLERTCRLCVDPCRNRRDRFGPLLSCLSTSLTHSSLLPSKRLIHWS